LAEKPCQVLEEASGIAPDVVVERDYWTAATADELAALGFAESQRNTPALVLPIHNVDGEVTLHTIRPNEPRRDASGKTRLYELPAGCRMSMDVPPRVRRHLGDPNVPLLNTERVKKVDSAINHAARCVVGLIGDLELARKERARQAYRPLRLGKHGAKDRETYIVFDSDVMEKECVQMSSCAERSSWSAGTRECTSSTFWVGEAPKRSALKTTSSAAARWQI